MENTYIAHHGILGQKWGVRRYQNPDGSLKRAGQLRYGYHSQATYKYKQEGNNHAHAKSKELDQKISQHRYALTDGDRFIRAVLVGPASQQLTYDMARSMGYSKGRSWLKAKIDLSVPGFAGDFTQGFVQGMANKAQNDKVSAIGTVGGIASKYAVDNAVTARGGEMSLRQRSLRKRYITGNNPADRAKKKEED